MGRPQGWRRYAGFAALALAGFLLFRSSTGSGGADATLQVTLPAKTQSVRLELYAHDGGGIAPDAFFDSARGGTIEWPVSLPEGRYRLHSIVDGRVADRTVDIEDRATLFVEL